MIDDAKLAEWQKSVDCVLLQCNDMFHQRHPNGYYGRLEEFATVASTALPEAIAEIRRLRAFDPRSRHLCDWLHKELDGIGSAEWRDRLFRAFDEEGLSGFLQELNVSGMEAGVDVANQLRIQGQTHD